MKNVVVDFSHLADMNGFGEIARNYAPLLAEAQLDDIHLIFIVPDQLVGSFGSHIDYIRRSRKREDLKRLTCHIDLWHATDQQFHLRGGDKQTIQLLTVHDLNFLREKSGLHRWRHIIQLNWRMRRSDHLTCISQYVKDDILAHYHIGGKALDVIYNGIGSQETGVRSQETGDRSQEQRPSFVSDDKPFFFTIGQIREKKNFQTLVPMMKYLPDYRLYISGDDHFAFAQELRKLIETEGEGRVMMTGKISDAEKRWLYSHAEAFLFPSRLEGFGIPVLEAMRYRCKVFSSRFSSLPEVCGNHATYWDDYEPQAMAEVVRKGLAAWKKEGPEATAALEHSLGFNYESYTESYIRLYRQLLAEGK
ncbi:MAG: glycosyltransferase family 4 protein [Prevotella sp.]|nr:glycosyltransferase family 4 protein [Prevotella sp.]